MKRSYRQMSRSTVLQSMPSSVLALFLLLQVFTLNVSASGADINVLAAEENDKADAILAQPTLPEAYGQWLLAQLDSPEESTVWKNYILQKLDVLYLHPDVDLALRPVVLDRLWQESRSPVPTFAGTSLMTLLRLFEQKPEGVSSEKLAARCQWVIDRPAYSNSDRLSALHVLSAIDQSEAAETARKWLVASDMAPMLQLTALNVLGKNPQSSDLQLIEKFIDHPDLRLRTAANSSLNRRQ